MTDKDKEKTGFFARLKSGLSKTRNGFVNGMDSIFKGFKSIDEEFYEELEEMLIMGDVGVNTTNVLIEKLRESVKKNHVHEPSECRELLIESIKEIMAPPEDAYSFTDEKTVIMVVGVNGVGKTTTVGKLASRMKESGRKVLVAAADTFRAAANEQLTRWAERAGVDIVSSKEGTDPASVVYDAVTAAKARNVDVLLCDTAGRLHNKKNLMDELAKMNRIVDREYSGAVRETWVVLDATTGQNAVHQAREFNEAAHLSGIVLTKMDGTAKGGIAIAISSELNIPVKYIGVGEGIDDLQRFDCDEFVTALFDVSDSKED
ncbi:MAG: signal recognition particle-docking protein FtsY [Lachnospiraceae bacterium]|nr:signal recognition particle-docking protein FtsY [Lachnospiraceae bacterium]